MAPLIRPIALSIVLLSSAAQVRDVDGTVRDPFAPAGAANVILFVASDCPISNGYAPELQRICRDYRTKGVVCSLVYEDVSIDAAHVRAHREAYGYKDIAAVIDGDGAIAKRAKATVTPQDVVVGPTGIVKYRGRIDNQFAALGKPRRVVTVHDVRDALDALLAGRAVAHPDTEAFGCFIPRRNQP
jgi:thiol-disulfide isomerase/thioredoxin